MESVALYIRTSSLANVEGDSHDRQEIACREYAKNHGMKPVIMGIDDGVSGGEHIHNRKGLMDLIGACQDREITKILCEDVSRFSRDMMVQETAYRSLIEKGIQVIPVKTPDIFSIDASPKPGVPVFFYTNRLRSCALPDSPHDAASCMVVLNDRFRIASPEGSTHTQKMNRLEEAGFA